MIAWMVATSRLINIYKQRITGLEGDVKLIENVIDIHVSVREGLVENVEYYKQGLDDCWNENVKLLKLLKKEGRARE